MGIEQMDFGIFLLHRLANKWNLPVREVYKILVETNIFDEYILNCYDTLHTLGEEYLVSDITEFAKEKGANI